MSAARTPARPHQAHGVDDVRARAWKFVFDCHEKKKAGAAQNTGHDAMKGSDNDDRAKPEYTG